MLGPDGKVCDWFNISLQSLAGYLTHSRYSIANYWIHYEIIVRGRRVVKGRLRRIILQVGVQEGVMAWKPMREVSRRE